MSCTSWFSLKIVVNPRSPYGTSLIFDLSHKDSMILCIPSKNTKQCLKHSKNHGGNVFHLGCWIIFTSLWKTYIPIITLIEASRVKLWQAKSLLWLKQNWRISYQSLLSWLINYLQNWISHIHYMHNKHYVWKKNGNFVENKQRGHSF